MGFIAVVNTPGYLPHDDDEHLFATARDAWAFLADERQREEDDFEYQPDDPDAFEYSDVWHALHELGTTDTPSTLWAFNEWGIGADGTGAIVGHTFGRPEHDLGVAYSVLAVDREPED